MLKPFPRAPVAANSCFGWTGGLRCQGPVLPNLRRWDLVLEVWGPLGALVAPKCQSD